MPFNIQFDPAHFIGIMLGFLIGTTIHEFMHAYTATMLGDDLPRRQGRVTLNPAAHFDPLGFFMFLLLALGVGFFAWGRPVMVNAGALRGGRRGYALVALAGPASNLVLGTILAIPFRFGAGLNLPPEADQILRWVIYTNFLLFVFNLIPLPPLDGFSVLVGAVSNYWAMLLEPIRRYGFAPLLALVFIPYFLPSINILGRLIVPVFTLIYALIAPNAQPLGG